MLRGTPMLTCVPLNLNAIERSPGIKEWIESWIPKDIITLKAEYSFTKGYDMIFEKGSHPRQIHHKRGSDMWTLPPAAVD